MGESVGPAMVDLNGHAAGNGGHSQGRPTAHRPLFYSERWPVHQRERTDIVVKTSSRKRSRADHGFGYFIEETYRGCLLLRLLIGTPQGKFPVLVHAEVARAICPGQMAGL